ncbi:MAG: 1-deoxy-D-xylulose-5-phosphate reductoisomerase [Chloroflexi bacterium]|nr:1-deoxy-D-xylulose-5-phosphate reductoisomerase [Chloroflexota bacterium]
MVRGVKRLAVLGSTGSIGTQTLDVVRANPLRFQVVGLAASRRREVLAQQVQEFHPPWVHSQGGEGGLPGVGPEEVRFLSLEEMAALPEVDLVVVATTGRAGLRPTLAALAAGKQVALANKEVLVMAGEQVMAQARRYGGQVLPIDSEHSALWQCLRGEDTREVARLILTASGGPFRGLSVEALARVTPQQALAHPTWRMGPRVTVDSATLMNKGMEVIEAHWLFGLPWERLDVVVHPQSVVHSLVEFRDGSLKAQLGPTDMRLPIQYALSYPERWPSPNLPRLSLSEMRHLDFEPLGQDRYPCFGLALEAARRGGTYPAVLCAADELAVSQFLEGRIGYLDIPRTIRGALEAHSPATGPTPSVEEVLAADEWARGWVHSLVPA